ncbi:MAG: hypothetical protein LBO62_05170, partial [Endomicrobium sp.]|nr:hypothetical protein [Endomicrobium sp.]
MPIKEKTNKFIAGLTALFFLFSGLSQNASAAIAASYTPQSDPISVCEPIISYSFGKINAGAVFGDLNSQKRVIINIQDLHCNPEVQKNIAAIISEIDKKYGLDELYAEGAYCDISAVWANAVGEKKKRALLDALLNAGRLTGSEYFCAFSDKKQIIKGVENYDAYSENIARFGRILEKQEYYAKQIKLLDKELALLQNEYLSSANKKFGRLIEFRKNKNIPDGKYYRSLIKYSNEIDLALYPNVKKYADLNDMAKSLKLKRINAQMGDFIGELKKTLPFAAYKDIAAQTDNFARLDDFYVYAPSLLANYGAEFDGRFADLKLFFDYLRREKEIGVLDLISEEKRLVEKIRFGLSQDKSELEISFVSNFYGYLKDYLSASISARDYQYFAANFDKFKNIWKKYVYESALNVLDADIEEINAFYETNFQRDAIFASKLGLDLKNGADAKEIKISSLDFSEISEILKNSKISIVVTGGFHSDGLQKIFSQQNISHIVITPNVSKTQYSNAIYTALAKWQAKRFERLALGGVSAGVSATAVSGSGDTKAAFGGLPQKNSLQTDAIALALGSADAKIEIKNNAVFASLNGENITFLWDEKTQNFNFETASTGIISSEIMSADNFSAYAENSLENLNSGQSAKVFSKAVVESVKKYFELLRTAFSVGGNPAPIFAIIEKFAAFASDEGFFAGYGLVFEIAQNENLQNIIRQNPRININQLAGLPELLQKLIAQNADIEELKREHFANPVISAVLNAPEFSNYVSAYKLFVSGKNEINYSIKSGAGITPKKVLKRFGVAMILGITVATIAFFLSPIPYYMITENMIEQRNLMIENAPEVEDSAASYHYMNSLFKITENIASGVTSVEKMDREDLFAEGEIEFYKTINLYQNRDFAGLADIVSDNTNDLRLRLFALLQLKRSENTGVVMPNAFNDFINSLFSKEGNVEDGAVSAIKDEFIQAVKTKSFLVDGDFHLKSAIFGTYLVWMSELEKIPGFENLPQNFEIYEKINKSVIVENSEITVANSEFIFGYDEKNNFSFMSHEIFHNILVWLSLNASVGDNSSKSYSAMHEFFAYIGEHAFSSLFLDEPYSYYKDEKRFFIFENGFQSVPQEVHQAGRGVLNFEQRVFERIKEEYNISLDWRILAETVAEFSKPGADYSVPQYEVFKNYTEILIQKICEKYAETISPEAVLEIFKTEDINSAVKFRERFKRVTFSSRNNPTGQEFVNDLDRELAMGITWNESYADKIGVEKYLGVMNLALTGKSEDLIRLTNDRTKSVELRLFSFLQLKTKFAENFYAGKINETALSNAFLNKYADYEIARAH